MVLGLVVKAATAFVKNIMAGCQLEGDNNGVNLKGGAQTSVRNGLYQSPIVQRSKSSCSCLFCGHKVCAGFSQLCTGAA